MTKDLKILNIFIDETGNFGTGEGTSDLYGLSFVFHDNSNSITKELKALNYRLDKIKYKGMIHTAELISKRDEYSNMKLDTRRHIFNYLFQFAKKIPAFYHSIIIDKRYLNTDKQLKNKLSYEIKNMIDNNKNFFKKFDKIKIYYDNGQKPITTILKDNFSKFNVEYKSNFDKIIKRLFQVADFLTYVDKYDYKVKNKLSITKSEKQFFTIYEYRYIIRKLKYKKLNY